MKRMLLLSCSLLMCSFLSGCASDPPGDAVSSVIQQMNAAAGDIGNITVEVDKAIKKHERDQTPLDFTEAIKIAKKLEETGIATQKVKVKLVDQTKVVDKEEKDELAQRFKGQIVSAFGNIQDETKKLNEALKRAEAIDSAKVEELRSTIRQAEGPFQALSRQS